MAKAARTLLIDFGDLPSLAAVVTQPDPSRLIIWHRGTGSPNASRCARMAREHAALVQSPFLAADEPPRTANDGEEVGALADGGILLAACRAARAKGCSKIIWPVQVGPVMDLVGRRVECAAIIAELTALDGESIEIEMPLIDLEDDQIVDLADDAGTPLDLFWACLADGELPCGGCPECTRWARAFEQRGLTSPGASRSASPAAR